jgi:site-specific DNA recombinase
MIRGIFERVAAGESTLNAEGARLAALGVAKRQRYGLSEKGRERGDVEGRVIDSGNPWSISSLTTIIHNPFYKGEGARQSRYESAAFARKVPALIDAVTWQRAQMALTRNRTLSRKNAKNTYLLRGLIRCADCGMGYTGTITATTRDGKRVSRRRYRCVGQLRRTRNGETCQRCQSKILRADDVEAAVWEACREFIRNPGQALDEARRKLRERMADATHAEDERRDTLAALAAKETERERVLAMYRRGKIDVDEADRELDAIA